MRFWFAASFSVYCSSGSTACEKLIAKHSTVQVIYVIKVHYVNIPNFNLECSTFNATFEVR